VITPVYMATRTLRGYWPQHPSVIVQDTTLLSFDPIASSYVDERDAEGWGRTVRVECGEEPTYWVGTLDGEMFRSTTGLLVLKTSRQKCMDAANALCFARMKQPGIWMAKRPTPDVRPPEPVAPSLPAAQSGPATQSGFGWD
jgi:hypothetical protein